MLDPRAASRFLRRLSGHYRRDGRKLVVSWFDSELKGAMKQMQDTAVLYSTPDLEIAMEA